MLGFCWALAEVAISRQMNIEAIITTALRISQSPGLISFGLRVLFWPSSETARRLKPTLLVREPVEIFFIQGDDT
jgi:hypothetical protein